MDVRPNGSQPSAKGLAECFTGNVRIDPLFEAPHPARARVTSVTLDPDGQQGSGGPDLRHRQAEAMATPEISIEALAGTELLALSMSSRSPPA